MKTRSQRLKEDTSSTIREERKEEMREERKEEMKKTRSNKVWDKRNKTEKTNTRVPEEKEEEPMEQTPKVEKDPVDLAASFNRYFFDFKGFSDFIRDQVCAAPSQEADLFCYILKTQGRGYQLPGEDYESQGLDFELFTSRAPEGYGIYIVRSATPFFDGIKHIFERIPHLNPSMVSSPGKISEHLFMILIDRLIYYYQIYQLRKGNKLRGFANSAGIVIYTHGAYSGYNVKDTRYIHDVMDPVKNVFICSKSAPGCVTCPKDISTLANEDSLLWKMSSNIAQKGYVNFDEAIFGPGAYCTEETSYVEDDKRGRSMENYISPNSNEYINKLYEIRGEYSLIINLETFFNVRDLEIPLLEKVNMCDICQDPDFQKRLMRGPNGYDWFWLSSVMEYCSENLKKNNVFIYDMACGTTPDTREEGVSESPPLTVVIQKTNEFARKGFGRSKRRRNRRYRNKNKNKHTKRRKTSRKTLKKH